MALAKETLCPVVAELTFIRKDKTEDGNGLILFFQSPEYLAEYGLELPVEHLLSNKSEEEKSQFTGNIKFTINADQLYVPVNQALINCEAGKKYIVKFGFSPQAISTGGSAIKYAKTKPINIYDGWADFFKELKAAGHLTGSTTANPVAATAS